MKKYTLLFLFFVIFKNLNAQLPETIFESDTVRFSEKMYEGTGHSAVKYYKEFYDDATLNLKLKVGQTLDSELDRLTKWDTVVEARTILKNKSANIINWSECSSYNVAHGFGDRIVTKSRNFRFRIKNEKGIVTYACIDTAYALLKFPLNPKDTVNGLVISGDTAFIISGKRIPCYKVQSIHYGFRYCGSIDQDYIYYIEKKSLLPVVEKRLTYSAKLNKKGVEREISNLIILFPSSMKNYKY